MAKAIIIVMLLPLMTFSQNNLIGKENKFIVFSYKESSYLDIAKDTIRQMFINQTKMAQNIKTLGDDAISSKFNFDELTICVIPKYRLKRIAKELFSCNSNIENFIEFEEKNKYMSVILMKDKKYVGMETVPNPIFEIEKINNPDSRLKVDKFLYEEDILKGFVSDPYYLSIIQEDIEKRESNFFFGIYGLWDIIFEINNESGILYANKFSLNLKIRMPANDYIRKYVGESKIKELARGYYEDIDGLGTLDEKACDKFVPTKEFVYLKVTKQAANVTR